jgi:hypothetical protein
LFQQNAQTAQAAQTAQRMGSGSPPPPAPSAAAVAETLAVAESPALALTEPSYLNRNTPPRMVNFTEPLATESCLCSGNGNSYICAAFIVARANRVLHMSLLAAGDVNKTNTPAAAAAVTALGLRATMKAAQIHELSLPLRKHDFVANGSIKFTMRGGVFPVEIGHLHRLYE